MPVKTTLSRFHSVDFFGTLLPGAFVMASAVFVTTGLDAEDSAHFWLSLVGLASTSPTWFPALLLVLASYLVGSIIGAFPVSRSDDRRTRFDSKTMKDNWRKLVRRRGATLYEDVFPYVPMLRRHYFILGARYTQVEDIHRFEDDEPGDTAHKSNEPDDWHVCFDYWKTCLELDEPDYIPQIHRLEARTRLFFGLQVAGLVSCVVTLTGALGMMMRWHTFTWTLFVAPVLCVAVWLPFRARLRYVRGDEARRVFLAYLVRHERIKRHEARAAQQGKGKPGDGAPP